MDASKTFLLVAIGLMAFLVMLIVIQLLLRGLKGGSESGGRLKVAYGVWFSILFFAFAIVMGKAVALSSEAIDIIGKKNSGNSIGEIVKVEALVMGVSVAWFVFWYSISNLLSVVILGKRNSLLELEADDVAYFLIKGVLVLGVIICVSPVLDELIRIFMPSIQIPFYH